MHQFNPLAVYEDQQMQLCYKHCVEILPTLPSVKVGIALNVRSGLLPINGLRHPPEGETSGWYIWAGEELSEAEDFFKPLHAGHLPEWCPPIIKFLGLPPGWRFLKAGDYEDVWYDAKLMNI
jgi:hypothetical protein